MWGTPIDAITLENDLAVPTKGKPAHIPCGEAIAHLGVSPTEMTRTTMFTAASFQTVPELEAT